MSDFIADLSSVYGTQAPTVASNSTNKKAGSDMVMDDFLKLMVAQFQNQSIDDTADTTEMMNQMVQMSVIQALTSLTTLISDSTNLSYAASLVGKEVTIGERYGSQGEEIKEILGTVTGTGTLDGKQVIFLNNEETPYYLTDIMAVGRLPGGENAAVNNSDATKTNAVEDVAERIYQETMRKIAESTQTAAEQAVRDAQAAAAPQSVTPAATETAEDEADAEEAAGAVTTPEAAGTAEESVREEAVAAITEPEAADGVAEVTDEAYQQAAEEVYENS